ncbi:hypothetical protein TRFO_33966 [Tritrichomonas foetus]|uniref:Peptidase C1A papain C-terminal domain-containing protein n=1 Tax=Tritrichomonas foetus TaxID=1144522 RepID=A0A1J4JQN8_9EUKA|nr:hypothetical protein TRFO_33966 [Tritrichomonas foetus]|eukprot:OHS99556.1 hypothetical protein TRFO_33966 [Tritrichomonas foetus]
MKSSEHVSLLDINNGKDKNSINKLLVTVTIVLFLCTGLAISIVPFNIILVDKLSERAETPVDSIIREIINESLDVFLPTRFSVHENFIIPPSDQAGRGTCWIFATLFMLESQYRENGIRKGFLNKDEYVLFSKQAYGSWVLQECARDSSAGVCHHGAPAHNTTNDHLIPTLYYLLKAFPNLSRSILPESVCPYITTDDQETNYKCDGMWEAIETNPIQFEISYMEVAREVESSKRLLVKSQRPLGLSFPIEDFVYYAPCDNSNYSTLQQCTQNSVKCPEGYTSEKCAKVIIESRNLADGTFAYLDDITRVENAGAHEINVVGYNDDWVYKNRKVSSKVLPTMKGGFIAHNSWRGNGHSVDYYMGRRSEENEAVICPNHNLSSSWIPTTFDCISQNHGDVTKCGTDFQRVRGKGMTKHTDLLGCKNSNYCDTNRNYAILQRPGGSDAWADPLFSGFDQTRVASWNKDGSDLRMETIDFFPFHMLHSMFYPVNYVANNPDMCGYWIVPYETVNMVRNKEWDLLDTYYMVDMKLEFPDSAYARSPESQQYNTTLLNSSTKVWDRVEFDGPLPYQYVY